MQPRRPKRAQRRFRVRFTARGSADQQTGYTVNISTTGMFVATNRPLPVGTRVRVQVGPENREFVLEAEVARALRVQQHLQSVRPSGMGLRFLTVAELVAELAPETVSQTSPEPSTGPRSPRPAAEEGIYQVVFNDRQQLLAALESDVKTGWLFVPTREPAAVDEVVDIDLVVSGYESETLRLKARVVERFEPLGGPEDPPNLLAGMGVQVSSFEGAMQKILGLLARIPS